MDIEAVYELIGRRALVDLGFSPQALSDAKARGKFPASWYEVINGLVTDRGEVCPTDLFHFRKAKQGGVS